MLPEVVVVLLSRGSDKKTSQGVHEHPCSTPCLSNFLSPLANQLLSMLLHHPIASSKYLAASEVSMPLIAKKLLIAAPLVSSCGY